jgi:hypothetical protein
VNLPTITTAKLLQTMNTVFVVEVVITCNTPLLHFINKTITKGAEANSGVISSNADYSFNL